MKEAKRKTLIEIGLDPNVEIHRIERFGDDELRVLALDRSGDTPRWVDAFATEAQVKVLVGGES